MDWRDCRKHRRAWSSLWPILRPLPPSLPDQASCSRADDGDRRLPRHSGRDTAAGGLASASDGDVALPESHAVEAPRVPDKEQGGTADVLCPPRRACGLRLGRRSVLRRLQPDVQHIASLLSDLDGSTTKGASCSLRRSRYESSYPARLLSPGISSVASRLPPTCSSPGCCRLGAARVDGARPRVKPAKARTPFAAAARRLPMETSQRPSQSCRRRPRKPVPAERPRLREPRGSKGPRSKTSGRNRSPRLWLWQVRPVGSRTIRSRPLRGFDEALSLPGIPAKKAKG